MEPSEDFVPRPRRVEITASFVVVNIIWWMVLLAAVGFGAIHFNSCPVEPYIPVYMIVLGFVGLLSLTVTYTKSVWSGSTVFTMVLTCNGLLYIFEFCWFIAGSVWVYSIYPPDYSSESPKFCVKAFYLFAFVVTTLIWASLGLLFVCGGCFFLCTCCMAVRAGGSLLPARMRFYGATGDYQQISGDV